MQTEEESRKDDQSTNEERKPVPKVYVIVRQDLSKNYQIPQSIHAKDEFTHKYPKIEKKWREESNTLAVLGIENEEELLRLVGKVQGAGLKFALFFEPDISEYTAVAVEPGPLSAELFADLKPAGYNHKKKKKKKHRRHF